MARDEGSDLAAFLAGFMVGGLVGAAVSLLLAPQAGEETRDQIRTRGIELRGLADDELDEIRMRAEQTLSEMRMQADELQERGLQAVKETTRRISNTVEQGVNSGRSRRASAPARRKAGTGKD